MVEQTFQQMSDSTKGASEAPKSIRDQTIEAGRELKDKAAEFAETSGEKLKEQASEFADMAKDVASQATDRLKDTMNKQRGAGAEYVSNLAETIRRAAREFDNDLPIAGKYIRKAAGQVENVSDSIRTGDFNELMGSAQAFARRQPTAFLGIAVLAGFAAVRFLKSSSEASAVTSSTGRRRPNQDNEGQNHDYQN